MITLDLRCIDQAEATTPGTRERFYSATGVTHCMTPRLLVRNLRVVRARNAVLSIRYLAIQCRKAMNSQGRYESLTGLSYL